MNKHLVLEVISTFSNESNVRALQRARMFPRLEIGGAEW